jgi:hypothetical protein
MGAGLGGVAGHGVLVHADQAAGGPGAAALAEVIQDVADRLVRESRLLQDGALAFGGAGLTGAAVDHPDAMAFAAVAPEGEISVAPQAGIGAVGILATEVFDGVHADRSGSQGLGAALLVWMTPSGTML